MALGAARMFNIELPLNFNSPYHATNIRAFWQRWHMTLSRFLREYLYIPLGGNRHGAWRTALAVMTTFVLGGLWHGAAWTFVAWGALHGAALVCYRGWERTGLVLPRLIAWAVTFLFVMIAWVFFRAPSFAAATSMLGAMAGMNTTSAAGQGWLVELAAALKPEAQSSAVWIAAILLAGLAVTALRRNSNVMVREFRPTWPRGLAVTLGLVASVLQLGKVAPFIYFNF
jgi:D-alanyl-lipoteichoic acid acyltransferase DltB (MBOAT superfamily)